MKKNIVWVILIVSIYSCSTTKKTIEDKSQNKAKSLVEIEIYNKSEWKKNDFLNLEGKIINKYLYNIKQIQSDLKQHLSLKCSHLERFRGVEERVWRRGCGGEGMEERGWRRAATLPESCSTPELLLHDTTSWQ